MRHCQKIRGELLANREEQTNYVQRAQDNAFGIYRPLTKKSAMHVRDVLTGAKVEAEDFLAKRRTVSAELVIPKDLGITYLMRGKVLRAMRFGGLLQRGFEPRRVFQSVEQHNSSKLDVPVEEFDWYTTHGRKLVSCFGESEAVDKLAADVQMLEGVLREEKGTGLCVCQPDHVSLYSYGRSRDNLDLSLRHKREVSGIIREHFEAANIGAVVLDKIVMGTSYSRPLRLA